MSINYSLVAIGFVTLSAAFLCVLGMRISKGIKPRIALTLAAVTLATITIWIGYLTVVGGLRREVVRDYIAKSLDGIKVGQAPTVSPYASDEQIENIEAFIDRHSDITVSRIEFRLVDFSQTNYVYLVTSTDRKSWYFIVNAYARDRSEAEGFDPNRLYLEDIVPN